MLKKPTIKLENYPGASLRIKNYIKKITKTTGVLLNKELDIQQKQLGLENLFNTYTSDISLTFEINRRFGIYLQRINPIFQVKSASKLLKDLYQSKVKASEKHIYEFLVSLFELIKINKSSLAHFLLRTISNYIDKARYSRDDKKDNTNTHIIKGSLLALLAENSGGYFLNIIDLSKEIKSKFENSLTIKKNLKYNKICKLLDSPIILEAKNIVNSQEYHIQMLNFFESILEKMEIFTEKKVSLFSKKYGYKTPYVYNLTENLTSLFSNFPDDNLKLPMLVKPLDWRIQSSDELGSDLVGGGYLTEKNKSGLKKNSNETKIYLQSYHAENLNFIQEQKYFIDNKLLDHIMDNFDECLYQYLLMVDSINEEILALFMQKNLEGYCYFSQEEFKSKFNIRLETNPDFAMGFSAIDMFNILASQIVKYYQIVYLARLYSAFKLEIYFTWYYDFRLRVYPRGDILSPHGGNLARSLLNPYNEEQGFNSFSDSSNQVVLDLKTEKKKKKNYFSLLKNNLKGGVTTVSLDASASGLQLVGACLGNLNVLILTNYLKAADNNSKKMDFYEKLTEVFFNELETGESTKSFGLTTEKFNILKKVLDRSFIKKWTIAFFYGQGLAERKESLIKRANSIRKIFPEVKDSEWSFFCFKTATFFEKAIENLCPGIINYMNVIRKKTKESIEQKKKKITISCGTLHSVIDVAHFTSMQYSKPKMKSGVRQRGTAIYLSSGIFDSKKCLSSILANVAHNRDAEVLQYVITECRKSKIGIVPIHDCMIVDADKADLIKTFYFKAVYDILLNPDSISFFLEINNVLNKDCEVCEVAKIWSDEREKIIAEIKSGSLEMNYYILK